MIMVDDDDNNGCTVQCTLCTLYCTMCCTVLRHQQLMIFVEG